jgi:hypothetical protein
LIKNFWKEAPVSNFINKTSHAPAPTNFQMKKTCPNCKLINFATAENCLRCLYTLVEISTFDVPQDRKSRLKSKPLVRVGGVLVAAFIALFGFYMTLIMSAKKLEYEEKKAVERAILILEEKGFAKEVFLLRYLTAYRGTDNWLNASTREENAYAATNFPFEIMTIYPDFYVYPKDDIERAAILLHEAQHLKGADEKEAYEYVWKNRKQLGWTKEAYGGSIVWRNVRRQTSEIAPLLFVCNVNEYADCTE